MTIWGLIIGGVTGFAFGGPIGALLGAAAGSLAGQQLRRHLDPDEARKVAFTVAVIALSAKMARADGVVASLRSTVFDHVCKSRKRPAPGRPVLGSGPADTRRV